MYGPMDHFGDERSHALGALIMKIVDAKIHNTPEVVIWGTGEPIREWMYVSDAAQFIVKLVTEEPFFGPINVGIGKGISITDLCHNISDIVGYEGEFIHDLSKSDGPSKKV